MFPQAHAQPPFSGPAEPSKGEACTPKPKEEQNSLAGPHGDTTANDPKAAPQAPGALSSPPRPEKAWAFSPEGTDRG